MSEVETKPCNDTYYLDRILTFEGPAVTEPYKVARCKLLEEAAEAFSEAQAIDEIKEDFEGKCDCDTVWLADEVADVIQAACNLARIHGITPQELDEALLRCYERNHERGRL